MNSRDQEAVMQDEQLKRIIDSFLSELKIYIAEEVRQQIVNKLENPDNPTNSATPAAPATQAPIQEETLSRVEANFSKNDAWKILERVRVKRDKFVTG